MTYPSRTSSLSAISSFAHVSVNQIMSGSSLSTYNSNSILFAISIILLTLVYITLAHFFLCYLYPLFWAYLLLPHLYNFHYSWSSLYPVDPFPRLLCVLLLFAFFYHCSTQFSFTCCHIMCY